MNGTPICLGVLGIAAACAASLATLPFRTAASPAADENLAEIWSHRCASCHAVPDPEIRTDRAWLDQVHRTA